MFKRKKKHLDFKEPWNRTQILKSEVKFIIVMYLSVSEASVILPASPTFITTIEMNHQALLSGEDMLIWEIIHFKVWVRWGVGWRNEQRKEKDSAFNLIRNALGNYHIHHYFLASQCKALRGLGDLLKKLVCVRRTSHW